MTDRELMQQALDALEINNQAWKQLADSGDAGFWEAEEQPFYGTSVKAITALRERLAQPEHDWDWRHPKAQALIGAKARLQIKLRLVEQLLEDPNLETTASDMEYWEPLHDKLQERLAQPEQSPLDRMAENARELGLDYEPVQKEKPDGLQTTGPLTDRTDHVRNGGDYTPEPVAMRYDFDGYGYRYIDSGSGSNWQTRIKDAEPLYAAPQQSDTKVNFEAIPKQISAPVAHSIVAGALFDLMGWLTTRREPLVLSGADDAAPAADAIRDFAQMRSLSINDAQVQEWQEHLTTPPRREWVGLTEKEAFAWRGRDYFETYRAIEAKLKEKNA